MLSGPRNISTALMRAWGSRPDTYVCDEPLYAHYLSQTDASRHPGYRETLSSHETDVAGSGRPGPIYALLAELFREEVQSSGTLVIEEPEKGEH